MSIDTAISKASAKATGKRPYFLNPEVERVMAIAMAIAQELAVTRMRLDTLERLLARKNVMTPSELEQFSPSGEEVEQRALWTQEYIARVLRIVQQEAEQISAGGQAELASEEVAERVERGPSAPAK
jgi:hypothetical protein